MPASWEILSSFEPLQSIGVSACHAWLARFCAPHVRELYPPTLIMSLLGFVRIRHSPSLTRQQKRSKPLHFGCMSPDCDHTCTSFNVDHVNCGMKAAKYGNSIKNGAQVGYRCISQLNPCCRSNSSAIIYQYKKDAIWAEARLLSQHWWKSEENPLEEAKKQKIAPK